MTPPVYIPGDNSTQHRRGASTLGQTLYQERVAKFGLCGFLVGVIFYLFRAVSRFTHGRLTLLHPSYLYHALGLTSFLLVWLVARRGRYRFVTIRVLEYGATFLSAGLYAVMCQYLPVAYRPDFVLLLWLTYVIIVRSALIPSSARRTGVIAVVMGVILVVGCYTTGLRAELLAYPVEYQREMLPGACVFRCLAWWALTSTMAIMISHVIYGLQREIRRARRLGQYALEEKLGEGGMGVVYRASHALLRRPTAVKLLAPEKAGSATIERFEREVRLTARLTHPNTVTIYDYGRTPEGIFYYAMELLDGPTLEHMVGSCGALPPARVVHIGSQIASALGEAHGIGLIHRDIKPANVILCERGGVPDVVKVVDFGLVKELETTQASLTHPGTIAGTPLYLAPEAIARPEQVDARVDLYALGALLYYLLAGEHVFHGQSSVEVCAHHLHTVPVPIAQRCPTPIPAPLAALVMDCLAKDPNQRPQSADQVLERLRLATDGVAWSAREARAWWNQHGSKLRTPPAVSTVDGQDAIAVDLQHR